MPWTRHDRLGLVKVLVTLLVSNVTEQKRAWRTVHAYRPPLPVGIAGMRVPCVTQEVGSLFDTRKGSIVILYGILYESHTGTKIILVCFGSYIFPF